MPPTARPAARRTAPASAPAASPAAASRHRPHPPPTPSQPVSPGPSCAILPGLFLVERVAQQLRLAVALNGHHVEAAGAILHAVEHEELARGAGDAAAFFDADGLEGLAVARRGAHAHLD